MVLQRRTPLTEIVMNFPSEVDRVGKWNAYHAQGKRLENITARAIRKVFPNASNFQRNILKWDYDVDIYFRPERLARIFIVSCKNYDRQELKLANVRPLIDLWEKYVTGSCCKWNKNNTPFAVLVTSKLNKNVLRIFNSKRRKRHFFYVNLDETVTPFNRNKCYNQLVKEFKKIKWREFND